MRQQPAGAPLRRVSVFTPATPCRLPPVLWAGPVSVPTVRVEVTNQIGRLTTARGTRGGVMSLTIEHTEAEGTLLLGTYRGDGSAEVAKALGWRWGRSIGLWFIPRSRDTAPRRPLIEQTAARLREAGFTVDVSIDSTPGDRSAAEERKADRASARAERLQGRAEREEAKAEERYAASRQIADGIPFGQPILLGHHSQARAERDARRIRQHMDASIGHQQRANADRAAAATAAAATVARHSPVIVANRIERLGAEIRRTERSLAALAAGAPTFGRVG